MYITFRIIGYNVKNYSRLSNCTYYLDLTVELYYHNELVKLCWLQHSFIPYRAGQLKNKAKTKNSKLKSEDEVSLMVVRGVITVRFFPQGISL